MSKVKATELDVPPAVRRYMEALELQLKQIPGVCPEDALADAREFLLSDYQALLRSAEPPDAESHYAWIVSQFGEPNQVAEQYSSQAIPVSTNVQPGYAPGWRICCTTCGRSAPYATTGGIRIGAISLHKYVLGRCSNCNGLRWCRLLQDLVDTNLTQQLCLDQTPEQLRNSMHLPVGKMVFKIVLGVILLVISIQMVVWLILFFGFRVFGK